MGKYKEILRIILIIAVGLVIAYFTYQAFFNGSTEFGAVAMTHFKAIVGLPAATMTALILVLILKQSAGPIEFKGLSFEFKGTSGEVILWVVCFLAIVFSIDKLW